ncbi:MAG: single-stranded DNA-binding protein [bacterium]
MAAFNRVILMGNLTKDPELRYTPSGSAVAHLSLAVNRRFTSKEGETKEEVDFFDIEAWDRQAELCSEYLNKGSGIFIEGRLRQDRWQDETGNKRSRIKIVATTIQFLPKRADENINAGTTDTNALGENTFDDSKPPF